MNTLATHRRGVALLLALLALMLVGAASVGMLRTGANASQASRARMQQIESEMIVSAVANNVRRWLELPVGVTGNAGTVSSMHAHRAALEPGLNRVGAFEFEGLQVDLRAIDLSGCLHLDHLESFAADGLPEALRSLRTQDLLSPRHRDRGKAASPRVLPETIAAIANQKRNLDGDGVRAFPRRSRVDQHDEDSDQTVSMLLTAYGSGRLNVRTAPVSIVEAALRGRDPALAAQLLDLRRAGAAVPDHLIDRLTTRASPELSRERDADRYVPLTGDSTAVGVLISIRHEVSVRRWWMVFERADTSRSGSEWLQREQRRID